MAQMVTILAQGMKRSTMEKFEISFIGAGNVAWHLAPALDNAGFKVGQVYSRDQGNAQKLIERLYEAEWQPDLDFSDSPSKLFFITVKDSAIEDIATEIVLPENAVVVHTSGSQPLSILGYLPTENIGVFYPLQTFTKTRKIHFKEIPVCIEGQNNETYTLLQSVAESISDNVYRVDSIDRKTLHLAAVFACNFTNHLYTVARQLLERKGLDFEMFLPLIHETVNKSLEIGPENSQTGPAIRKDMTVIEDHLQYLSYDEQLSRIYRNLTEHIIVTYNP